MKKDLSSYLLNHDTVDIDCRDNSLLRLTVGKSFRIFSFVSSGVFLSSNNFSNVAVG